MDDAYQYSIHAGTVTFRAAASQEGVSRATSAGTVLTLTDVLMVDASRTSTLASAADTQIDASVGGVYRYSIHVATAIIQTVAPEEGAYAQTSTEGVIMRAIEIEEGFETNKVVAG